MPCCCGHSAHTTASRAADLSAGICVFRDQDGFGSFRLAARRGVLLHHLVRDVEVGVNVLHVLVFFELLEHG